MSTAGRETARARLRTRRKLIRLELASVERKIARVRGQVRSIEERIASLTGSQSKAA